MQADLRFAVKWGNVVAGFWVDSDGQIVILFKRLMSSCPDSRLLINFFTACPAFLILWSVVSSEHGFLVTLTPFFFAS